MPRFDMWMMVAELDGVEIEMHEFDIICYVEDPNNFEEINATAHEVAFSKIEEVGENAAFGTAVISVDGDELLQLIMTNKTMDPKDVNMVMDVLASDTEGAVH